MDSRLHPSVSAFTAICKSLAELTIAASNMSFLRTHKDDMAPVLYLKGEAERIALELLDENPHLGDQCRDFALATLSTPLITQLTHAVPGMAYLSDETLGRCLSDASPEQLRLMISRGLGIACQILPAYTHLSKQVPDAKRAKALARVIAEDLGPFERARAHREASRGPRTYISWNSETFQEVRTPLIADYMRAQVKAFPADALYGVKDAIKEADMHTTLVLFMAGVPIEVFLDSKPEYAPIARLVDKMKSNHGICQIQRDIGSLEDLIKHPVIARKFL